MPVGGHTVLSAIVLPPYGTKYQHALSFAGVASPETIWSLFILVKGNPPVASVQLRCQRVSRGLRAAQIRGCLWVGHVWRGSGGSAGLASCRTLSGCSSALAHSEQLLHSFPSVSCGLTPHAVSALPTGAATRWALRAPVVWFRDALSEPSEAPGLDGRMILPLVTPGGPCLQADVPKPDQLVDF